MVRVLVRAVIFQVVFCCMGACFAQDSEAVLQQCQGLLDQSKQVSSPDAKAALALVAERKALGVVEKVNSKSAPAWACLAKVAWFFGESNLVNDRAAKALATDASGSSAALVSEVKWLLTANNPKPLTRPADAAGPYEMMFKNATEAEKSGDLDKARRLYYSAHELNETGQHDQEISAGLLRLTIPVADKLALSGNWSEVYRLVHDYLRAFPPVAANADAEKAVYLAAKAAQSLRDPAEMNTWTTTYAATYPNGAHATEISNILGEVTTTFYTQLVNEIRLILRSGDPDKQTKAQDLIKRAEDPAWQVAGHNGAETKYLWGVFYANIPTRQYGLARKSFRDYLSAAPNGAFIDQAYAELRWLDQPVILFSAAAAGTPATSRLLWTVRSDGSDPRPISSLTQGFLYSPDGSGPLAVVSPDSSKVAFVTSSSQGLRVYCANPDGTEPREIWSSRRPTDIVGSLSWSPSRTQHVLKFHGQKDGGNLSLWIWQDKDPVANEVPDSSTALSSAGALISKWSPDGSYLGWRSEEACLYVTESPFGPNATRRIQMPDTTGLDPSVKDFVWTQPTWPGSRPIVIGCTPNSAFKVEMQPDAISAAYAGTTLGFLEKGSRAAWQVMARGTITQIGCSSDGDTVGFLTAAGNLQLFQISADSTPRTGPPMSTAMTAVRSVDGVTGFEFSPTGARLAYRTNSGVYISRFDAFAFNDRQVAGTTADTALFWSPRDGQLLTTKPDQLSLTFDREALNNSFLPAGDVAASNWENPQWSPDGSMFAITKTNAGGASGIVLSVRQSTLSQQNWIPLQPPACAPGTERLVGWVSSL